MIKFFLLFFPFLAMAQENKSLLKITPAIRLSSLSTLRGAVTFPHFGGFIGPSLTIVEKLKVRGPSLSWDFFEKGHHFDLQLGARLLNDGEPMLEFSDFDEDNDYRSSRNDSLELSLSGKYKFGPRKLFHIGLSHQKEIHRHFGGHFLFSFQAPVYRFTSLRLKIGHGSESMNQYLYGANAEQGLSYQETSLNLTLPPPKLPWNGMMFFSLVQSWVLKNDQASLVRGEEGQFKVELSALFFLPKVI